MSRRVVMTLDLDEGFAMHLADSLDFATANGGYDDPTDLLGDCTYDLADQIRSAVEHGQEFDGDVEVIYKASMPNTARTEPMLDQP